MNYLIKIAVVLVFSAVFTGNLHWIIHQVRKAQVQIIIESQASKRPKVRRLPIKR